MSVSQGPPTDDGPVVVIVLVGLLEWAYVSVFGDVPVGFEVVYTVVT
jgi:hypothetical protein